jgi:hypothetical protein
MQDLVRILAAWALVHEVADEGWKAAVDRGRKHEPGDLDEGPEALVDGLAALVADEKERLKRDLGRADDADATSGSSQLAEKLDAMAFELAELRGRMESLQASVDAIAARDRD